VPHSEQSAGCQPERSGEVVAVTADAAQQQIQGPPGCWNERVCPAAAPQQVDPCLAIRVLATGWRPYRGGVSFRT
jgi:hypothetical protein